ncbi:CHASE2 domain-containing protein [Sessilibacter corallicola]|uniref:histidine kinase n=1 Tax=Sessilibacter corallicola TaxID=2904075 RepID=A0ABQ0A422_9GAMM
MLPFNAISSVFVERFILALVMALLAITISISRWGYSVDQAFYDAVLTRFPSEPPKDLLIVAIDERSLLEIGRWPWSRRVHAQLLDKLREADAQAVAFDIIFPDPDRYDPQSDQIFSEAIANFGSVVLSVHMEQTYQGGQILEVLPTPILASSAAALGHVHVEYDVDGVCRAVFLKEGLGEAYWPHLMLSLLNLVYPDEDYEIPGLRPNESITNSSFAISRDYFNLIPLAGPPPQVESVSYTDVIHDRIPLRTLSDKVVLIGATAQGMGDLIATPFGTMDGVEFNANIYKSLLHKTTIIPVDVHLHWIFSCIIVFVLILSGAYATPRQYFILTSVYVLSITLLSAIFILYARLWFAPLAVIIPLLLFYPIWSWRRLEQAIRFLRRELYRAQQEAESSNQQIDTKLAERLTFVAKIVGLSQWQISDGSSDGGKSFNHMKPIDVVSSDNFNRVSISWDESSDMDTKYSQLWRSAIDLNANVVEKPEKKPAELVTATIQSLRKATQEAEINRKFTRQCLENIRGAIVVTNIFGEAILINDTARSSFDLVEDKPLHLLEFLHDFQIDGNWLHLIQTAILEQTDISVEAKLVNTEKEYLCQLVALNWQSKYTDTLLFSFTDITMVKESERARTEALHFLSHDLRSPVVSILALIEQYRNTKLNRDDVVEKSEVNSMLSDIEAYARKNLSFAESFLQLARAEIAGQSKFDLCDIHSVIDNALLMVRHPASQKKIKIDISRTMDDMWVEGDGELLERLLINLLTNAIKYSSSDTLVQVFAEVEGSNLVIKVKDQGHGIKPEDLPNIFQRFKRVAGQTNVSGAGLGLHFVEIVARKHGGSVRVESEFGKGSCFIVVLPAYQDDTLLDD